MDAWAKPVCNVSAKRSEKSMRAGMVSLAVALGLSVLLHELAVPAGYRAVLFFPFAVAALGTIKGLFGVCSYNAARGRREMDDGTEEILDPDARRKLAVRGQQLAAAAFAAAGVLTALFVFAG